MVKQLLILPWVQPLEQLMIVLGCVEQIQLAKDLLEMAILTDPMQLAPINIVDYFRM
jgi:hypothetical protein